MKLAIILHSASYVLALCGSFVAIKIFNYYYSYSDYMYTLLLYAIFAPINFLPFIYVSRGITLDMRVYLPFFIPAIIYALETILLSFTLNQMPLGLYVIARTSYSIFNYVSYKYIMKRQLNRWYYLGVVLLLSSYGFIMLDYTDQNSLYGILMFSICLATGLSTSIYNTLAEFQLSRLQEHKLQYTFLNNAIFQMTSFVINIPLAVSEINPTEIRMKLHIPLFIVLSIIAALGLQIFSTNKFFILNDANVNGSMIVSSLDLVRRIVLNTVSYTLLKETISVYNMVGNGLLLLASFSLFYSSNNGGQSNVEKDITSSVEEDKDNDNISVERVADPVEIELTSDVAVQTTDLGV